MARLVLVELMMFIGALGMTYLLRRVLGRRISGPPVILWCVLFAFVGAQLMALFLRQIALDSDFIDLSNASIFSLIGISVVRFWENILLGGVLGMLLANFPLRKKPKDTQPKR